MNEHGARARIYAAIEESGSQQAFAARCGISAQYLSDILKRRRAIPDSVLRAVGLERVVTYREVRDE